MNIKIQKMVSSFFSLFKQRLVLYYSRGISVHAFEFSKAKNLSAQYMG